jgi:hypothetical protein
VIIVQLAFLFAWLTQSVTTPVRTGDVARQLTEQDVAAIEHLLPSGAKPWLLSGDPAQAPGREYVQAYLSPTNITPVLRRGTVITLTRRTRPFPDTDWTVQETRSYAQVAIPGRAFDDIKGEQDVNRPFLVFGPFDDDELVRLVEFLRSDPRSQPERIQSWPIVSVQRQGSSVQVLLRGGVMRGQSIILRQAGQDWVIVNVGTWIA